MEQLLTRVEKKGKPSNKKEEESKTNRLKLIPRGSNYSSRYNKLSATKEKRLTILQQAKQGLH